MFKDLSDYNRLSPSERWVFEHYRNLVVADRKEILDRVKREFGSVIPSDVLDATMQAVVSANFRIHQENEKNPLISERLEGELARIEKEARNSDYMKRRKEVYG